MLTLTPYQQVEVFHLLFLRHLEGRLDKTLYAVKGGCNLRFFMKSIRYSEDLDIDARTVARITLAKKIDGILTAPAFRSTLLSRGIEIAQFTAVKQTDTTQRWKLQLKLKDTTLAIPTKIEFSRRKFDKGAEFGPVEPELIRTYQLYQILCSHYGKDAACRQKLEALLGRTEVQARDVFDLGLLIDQGATPLGPPLQKKMSEIESVVMGIDFAAFKSQVVSYLAPEYQAHYGSKETWSQLQEKVLQAVEAWV